MNKIQKAILKTLSYADIFDFPLSKSEIWRYLINIKASYFAFQKNLVLLEKNKKIIFKKNFYCLKNQQKIIQKRILKKKIAFKKTALAKKIGYYLKLVPWVEYIGISGALAMENSPRDDDIDLFVITYPNRVWITRFILTVFLDIFNLRRQFGEYNYQDKFCLNMFMDRNKLKIPIKNQTLFTAHEIVQCKTLVNKNQTYEKFLKDNFWINKFMPQAVNWSQFANLKKKIYLTSKIVDFMEIIFQKIQYFYMHRHITSETVEKNIIKFHPINSAVWIDLAFQRKIKNII